MRLFRGSGSVGLSAMPYKRDVFIRPLLSIQRKEILEYLKRRGMSWREDASNLDTQYLRNRLRQELIPSLRDRYNQRIVPQLATTADILREESEALQCWATEVFEREAVVEGNSVSWNVDTLHSLPFGLQKRLVRLSFEKTAPGDHKLSAQNVASIMALLGAGKSGMSVRRRVLSVLQGIQPSAIRSCATVCTRRLLLSSRDSWTDRFAPNRHLF